MSRKRGSRNGSSFRWVVFLALGVVGLLPPGRALAQGRTVSSVQDLIEEFQRLVDLAPEGAERIVRRFFTPLGKKLERALADLGSGNLKRAVGRIGGVIRKLDRVDIVGLVFDSEVGAILSAVLSDLEGEFETIRARLNGIPGSRQVEKLRSKLGRAEALVMEARFAREDGVFKSFFRAAKSALGTLGSIGKKLGKLTR